MMQRNSLVVLFLLITATSCTKKQYQQDIVTSVHEQEARERSTKFFNEQPGEKPVSYLYAPGFKGTEVMMGRYCPQYTAATGEKVTWRDAGHTIGQPHSAVVFPETDLRKPGGFTLNPIKAYIDRFRQDLFPLAQRFFQEQFNFTVEDNPSSKTSIVNYSFSFRQANIGQKTDIKAFKNAYKHHAKKYPHTDIVLYGDSRGAATIFNFIAQEKPQQVKAAVIEGIFDDINHLFKHFIYSDKEDRAEKRMHNTINFVFGKYSKKGPFPRDYAEQITDDIPLLFVTSAKDNLCCPQGAFYLYNRLRARGHNNSHLLVLNNSWHPTYMIGNKADRELYETTVHAFYKKYGLPHNKERAAAGQASFDTTQPTAEQLKEHYKLPRCTMCEQPNRTE